MTPKGKLIAIGGNEDKGKEPEAGHNVKVFGGKFIEEGILKRVVDEIGGTGKLSRREKEHYRTHFLRIIEDES